jgi:hypothetical protein
MQRNTRRVVAASALALLLLLGACSVVLERAGRLIGSNLPAASSAMKEAIPSIDWAPASQWLDRRSSGWLGTVKARGGGWVLEMLESNRVALCRAADDLCRSSENPPEILDELDESLDQTFGVSLEEKVQAVLNWFRTQVEKVPTFSPTEQPADEQAGRSARLGHSCMAYRIALGTSVATPGGRTAGSAFLARRRGNGSGSHE